MDDIRPARFDIVIPNWNGRQMLEICLESLRAQSLSDFEVFVIDNGSSDGSVDFVRRRFPETHIVAFGSNRGFSAAVNAGIAAGHSEWVLLLNNDIEVERSCLAHLAAAAGAEPDYRLFALQMRSYADRDVLDGAGDGVLRGGVGYRLGTMEKSGGRYALKREVFGPCAGAGLYHRSLFAEIGWFDEDFFAYLEDVDFNLRANRADHRCCYVPQAIVYHVGSASTGSKINPFTVRLTTRNSIYVMAKNCSPTLFLRFLPAFLVYQFFWFLFVVKKRHFSSYLKGIFEVFSGLRAMARKGGSGAERSRLPERDFAARVVLSERAVIDSIMSRRAAQGKGNILLRCYLALFC